MKFHDFPGFPWPVQTLLWQEKITENRTYVCPMFIRQSSTSNLHGKNNKKAEEELYRYAKNKDITYLQVSTHMSF